MAIKLLFDEELRERLISGVDCVADAVRVTMGPCGRNVIMLQPQAYHESTGLNDPSRPALPGAPALVTRDGVSVARSIALKDRYENMAASLMKVAASKTNEQAGDGTTTTIVLTQAIVHEGVRNIAAGADPFLIKKGMNRAAEAAIRELLRNATPVEKMGEIAQVARISCGEEKAGGIIAEAFEKVGLEGVVKVDSMGRGGMTELEVSRGIVFERGFMDPLMINDAERQTAELEDPYILITDHKIDSSAEILDILLMAAQDGRGILLIAEELGPDAKGLIMRNKMDGDLDIVAVEPPLYGEGRVWRLDDLAVQTGGRFISRDRGDLLSDVKKEDLGSARHVSVSDRQTVIIRAHGDPEAVDRRIRELRYLADNTDYEFNRQRHKERLAKFVSGIAVIHAGGDTDVAIKDEKLRIEDGVNAVRAAMEEGIVAGGGTAYIDVIPEVSSYVETFEGDERTGGRILLRALESPCRQIAANGGDDGGAVAEEMKKRPSGTGWDVSEKKFRDMIAAGIVDPVKVEILALRSAVSVSSALLTANAGIVVADDRRDD